MSKGRDRGKKSEAHECVAMLIVLAIMPSSVSSCAKSEVAHVLGARNLGGMPCSRHLRLALDTYTWLVAP